MYAIGSLRDGRNFSENQKGSIELIIDARRVRHNKTIASHESNEASWLRTEFDNWVSHPDPGGPPRRDFQSGIQPGKRFQ
jgi:hypothetical protein